jgi:hydrogenase nickel incorporation protein HypB
LPHQSAANAGFKTRILEVREGILKKNDVLAHQLRARFEREHVFVVNLVSSPGSGKTELLKETLYDLRKTHVVAALVGDLATDNDAQRLAKSGAPARQIVTGTICHLEADMVQNALDAWSDAVPLADLDMLFIENVGNLVCPASYDLGENLRVVVLSVTEGEDKPLKYPTMFNTADVAVITKIDLAEAVGFDRETAVRNMRELRPNIRVVEVSAKTGEGMAEWIRFVLHESQPVCGSKTPHHKEWQHLGEQGRLLCQDVKRIAEHTLTQAHSFDRVPTLVREDFIEQEPLAAWGSHLS